MWREMEYVVEGRDFTPTYRRYNEEALMAHIIGLLIQPEPWTLGDVRPGFIELKYDHQGTRARWTFEFVP